MKVSSFLLATGWGALIMGVEAALGWIHPTPEFLIGDGVFTLVIVGLYKLYTRLAQSK